MRVLIIGAGIGGLTAALALHARGIRDVIVTEQAPTIGELGVGINVLPHAVKELTGLGLLHQLDATGVRTGELLLTNRHGDLIIRQACGVEAGHRHPQFSIHRGRLQGVLAAAVRERLGEHAIRTGHRCTHLERDGHDDHGVTAWFVGPHGATLAPIRADVLVGADGIHSRVRAHLFPHEGDPIWSGKTLYRGATEWPAFGDGQRMIIAGAMAAKLVVYPIAPTSRPRQLPGGRLTNWVIMREQEPGAPPPERQDWARPANRAELAKHLRLFGQRGPLADVDLPALIQATPDIYEFPMCDREPLTRWSHGRVTLLGDAAHPMYPNGANGAGQAILDAAALAAHLTRHRDPTVALANYDAERRPATTQVVRLNRRGATEHVIELVDQLAPDGFARIDQVIDPDEIDRMLATYHRASGLTDRGDQQGPGRGDAARPVGPPVRG